MDQRTPDDSSRRKLKKIPGWRARQGVSFGIVHYVLGVSLALVIVAFAIIWFLNFNF